MEINWKKPTSRETDEPFGWQLLIALNVPKLQHILFFFSYMCYMLIVKLNYLHSNAIIETKRIQKPDLAIRIAWIGLAGTLFLFLAACNGSGY